MKTIFNKEILVFLFTLSICGLEHGFILGSQLEEEKIAGAIVANGRECADIGGKMLNIGGSAIDAAVATLLCDGVTFPQSMGVGGGFVATIYNKSTGEIQTLIARETAPAAATENMFAGIEKITGAIAGGVPGELLGYYEMHKNYGQLPWNVLFEPTIKLCKEGHWVSKDLANDIQSVEKQIRAEPSLAEIFVKEDGKLYKEGDYMKRTQLGKTLEIIAEKGIGEFYGGEIGKMFAEDIQQLGGIITEQDLKDYKVRWYDKDHVTANVTGGYTLYSTPLPSSGPVLAFMLNVMNNISTENPNIYWQRVMETFKHAYGLRTNLGDLENEPDMAPTISQTLENLISKDFAKHINTLIYNDKTFEDFKYYGANFSNVEDHGTANMAVLAPNGDAVIVTSTVNTFFGSKVRSKRTGIILNDQMDHLSTPGIINNYGVPPSPANYIKPGKRPISSMCPAIILDKDGNVRMLVGAAGGPKITTSVATTIIKYLILNETMQQAIDDGRLHHQLAPMRVEYEEGVPKSITNYLESVGHKTYLTPIYAVVTAIGVKSEIPEPYFDRRRMGSKVLIAAKN